MKNEKELTDIKILGKTIIIDYDKEEILFPNNIKEEEIEFIACYLIDEGFVDSVSSIK